MEKWLTLPLINAYIKSRLKIFIKIDILLTISIYNKYNIQPPNHGNNDE